MVPDLPQRIRSVLRGVPGYEEKAMFGGVGFLIQGNMACGSHKGRLIVRVGPEAHAAAMSRPYTGPFDITGRPMRGWVMVAEEGYAAEDDLRRWVQQGLDFARSLPPK